MNDEDGKIDRHTEAKVGETKTIVVPEEEGVDTIVVTWENGQRSYIFKGLYDGVEYDSAMVISMMNNFLTDEQYSKKMFMAFPNAERPENPTWFSRSFMRDHIAHVHQARVLTPLAQRKMGGQEIVVPVPGSVLPFAPHGPGKRRN